MHKLAESSHGATDVLIVDDNADLRRLLRAALSAEFTTAEAEDGATALQMVRAHRPRLVLLDVMMHGDLNGLATLSAIREDFDICKTWVVMVTARSHIEDIRNARLHGADGYIMKPFSTLDVLDGVRHLLQKA